MHAGATLHPSATLSDSSELLPQADHIVVHKAERRLYLMQGGSVLRTYRVALGLNPVGQKERAGDSRTPEGRYYLTRRNPRSDYSCPSRFPIPTSATSGARITTAGTRVA